VKLILANRRLDALGGSETWAMATTAENRKLLGQIDRITSGGSYRLAKAIGRPAAWVRRRRR
jgi:hypothetical protein